MMSDMKQTTRFLLPALAVLLLLLASRPASAMPRQAVELRSFTGTREGDDVRLRWETGSEIDVVGFKVKRATSAGGPFAPLSDIGSNGIVLATGSGLGDTYEVVDGSAAAENNYWYTLVEVTGSNEEIDIATIAVPTAQESAAPTPTAAGTEPDPGQGNDPTPTATVGAAARRTQTPTSAAGTGDAGAPTATATRPPSRTPQPPDTPAAAATAAHNSAGARAVEAADDPQSATNAPTPAAVAQATQAPEAYPGPDGSPASEGAPAVEATAPPPAYPAEQAAPQQPLPDADAPPSGIGVGAEPPELESDETTVDEAQEDDDGSLGRVLLWIGFIGALLIFAVGVFFSIFLSMRQRDDAGLWSDE